MKSFYISALLALLFLIYACNNCDNMPKTIDNNAGVNLFDRNPSSQFFNQSVLNFTFSQSQTEYEDSECGDNTSVTTLRIINNTNKQVTLDYNINFIGVNSGKLLWSYQGVATIIAGPGTSFNVGTLNSDPTLLNYGNITVQSINVSYK